MFFTALNKTNHHTHFLKQNYAHTEKKNRPSIWTYKKKHKTQAKHATSIKKKQKKIKIKNGDYLNKFLTHT